MDRQCTVACAIESISWASGFVDGEGCISIVKTRQPGRKNPTYRVRLEVAQNNREVLVTLRENLGESAGLYANKRQASHNRQTYSLVLDGVHALRAVAKLRPHLRRKQAEADVLLSYEKLGWMGVHPGARGYPPEVWAERERICRKLRRLK